MGGLVKLFRRRKERWMSSDSEPEPEDHEEIEYEPVSLRERLVEMKDLSELILDLAYSAIVLDNQDIADEVEDLGARMATLQYHTRLQAMMASRNIDDAEQMSGILQVAAASAKIAEASIDIASLVESQIKLRDFMPHLLRKADEKMVRLKVKEHSKAAGAEIGEARIQTETGNRVIAVRRGKHWTYGPGRRFQLKAGDTLIVRGRENGQGLLKRWVDGEVDAL